MLHHCNDHVGASKTASNIILIALTNCYPSLGWSFITLAPIARDMGGSTISLRPNSLRKWNNYFVSTIRLFIFRTDKRIRISWIYAQGIHFRFILRFFLIGLCATVNACITHTGAIPSGWVSQLFSHLGLISNYRPNFLYLLV